MCQRGGMRGMCRPTHRDAAVNRELGKNGLCVDLSRLGVTLLDCVEDVRSIWRTTLGRGDGGRHIATSSETCSTTLGEE